MDSITQSQQLGRRLKAIREANGLSQRELAKRAGVTNSNISMIEQGQVSPSVHSLEKVLAAVPMSLSHFFACLDDPSDEVFFLQRNMLKHERSYGFMQIVAEHLPEAKIALKHLYFKPLTDTGDTPLMRHVDQAGWVCQGSVQITIAAEVKELSAGDGFYLSAYTPCRVKNVSAMTPAQIIVATDAGTAP
jgi:transcriptional regulator with XRE-family HTH domain